MEIDYNQFIGVYKNVLPKDWCKQVIDIYESSPSKLTRLEAEGADPFVKQDTHISKGDYPEDVYLPFYNFLISDILPHYNKKYLYDHGLFNFEIEDFKVQKTKPSEGYHIWHWENDCIGCLNRTLVYTAYLNDVKEGGETEFLYQSLRIKPQQGTICIFPSSFTHTHRGNPPLSNEKYIITGWVSIKNEKQ